MTLVGGGSFANDHIIGYMYACEVKDLNLAAIEEIPLTKTGTKISVKDMNGNDIQITGLLK